MSDLTYGIDVSHWTEKIDYAKVMREGYGLRKLIPAFNFAKASEGKWFTDGLYPYHIAESRKVGLLTGAYHYYREGYDPATQGRLFSKIYNDNGGTDLPPCIDIEVINNPSLNPSRVADCINEIIEHTKRKPIIYTGFYVWRDQMRSASWGKNYPLWLADYTPPPNVPYPWTDWTFWQWSDKAGDENWYNGSLESLLKFCGKEVTDPPISSNWWDGMTTDERVLALCEMHPTKG